jgi:hypothetical protein
VPSDDRTTTGGEPVAFYAERVKWLALWAFKVVAVAGFVRWRHRRGMARRAMPLAADQTPVLP